MSLLEGLALFLLLLSGVLVVTLRNAIHAALALILNFLVLAGVYVALDARFLGFIQVIVYAGAIVVLFLFVIMLLFAAQGEIGFDPLVRSRPLAALLALGVAGILAAGLWGLDLAFTQDLKGGLPQALGPLLYGDWLFVLLAVGFLLMAATVVAVALVEPGKARGPRRRRSGGGGAVSYLLTSALLFALGVYGVLTRRTAILVFLSIELMLNAANLSLVGFARAYGLDGQVAALMVIAVAAAEVAVGLGLIVAIFRHRESTAVDDLSELRG